uniref:Uncharacterized protein n=1 Tax=Panagrolaimus sp. ES5 TaxID=591445 RepID=A0AC34G8E3_9BILA
MLPPNIVYGHHHSLPCSSSNNGNNNNNNNSQLFHYQAPLNFCPPMVYVDGIWHRMPIPYPGNFMVPEPQFFFSPPPPSLENVFDYNNAIFVGDDLPEQPTQDNGHGLKRLTSAEITEEDLAFLVSFFFAYIPSFYNLPFTEIKS